MWCTKCNNHLSECKCPDINERLQSVTNILIFRKCKKCGKHYELCKCKDPEWVSSDNKHPLDPNDFTKFKETNG